MEYDLYDAENRTGGIQTLLLRQCIAPPKVVFLSLLLVSALIPVDAYQAEIRQELLTQDKTRVSVRYRFEWEIYDSIRYEKSGADKAQLQQRLGKILKNVLREHAGKSPESVMTRLANGEDVEQALAIAIKTNEQIAELGARLIDLEFLSAGVD